jgi:steroid delta-isomerase-like uncharacterized protein
MKTIVAAITLFLSTGALAQADDRADQRIAERVFLEKMGEGRFDRLDEIYDPAFTAHGAGTDYNLAEDNASGQEWRKAFPDLRVTVSHSLARDGLAAVHWRAEGTNTVAAAGLPGSGGRMNIDGMTFFRLKSGRIIEEWNVIDIATLRSQMGGKK